MHYDYIGNSFCTEYIRYKLRMECCPLNSMSRIGRQSGTGGRGKLLNEQQEQEICNMVFANNAITLRQIRTARQCHIPKCQLYKHLHNSPHIEKASDDNEANLQGTI